MTSLLPRPQPQPSRFRFGLSALLLGVAICAYFAWLYANLPRPVTRATIARLQPGDSPDTVLKQLGQPVRVVEHDDGSATWYYDADDPVYVWFENHKFAGALFESDAAYSGGASKSEIRQTFGPPVKRTRHGQDEDWHYEFQRRSPWVFVFGDDGRCWNSWSSDSGKRPTFD